VRRESQQGRKNKRIMLFDLILWWHKENISFALLWSKMSEES
jgi:hypothetical protein